MSRIGTEPRRGFAMIVVLWFLVLLAGIGIHVAAVGRSESQVAANLVASAKAEAMAEGAVARAAYGLGDPRPEQHWLADGSLHELKVPGGTVLVTVRDESGKIDVNSAPVAMIAALFANLGVDAGLASQLATAIHDNANPPKNNGPANPGEAATQTDGPLYGDQRQGQSTQPTPSIPAAAAGIPGLPGSTPANPNAFISLEELRAIPGMTAEIFAAVSPYLTVHTGTETPDYRVASLAVRRAIDASSTGPGARDRRTVRAGNPAPNAPIQPIVAEITATARAESGATFTRIAVIRTEASRPDGYQILSWRRPAGATASGSSDGAAAPS